jgi:hypothetical protein
MTLRRNNSQPQGLGFQSFSQGVAGEAAPIILTYVDRLPELLIGGRPLFYWQSSCNYLDGNSLMEEAQSLVIVCERIAVTHLRSGFSSSRSLAAWRYSRDLPKAAKAPGTPM